MSEKTPAVGAPLQTPVMQHTPGPWKFALFEHDPNEAFVQWRAGFAAVHGSRAGREANARLISAAPDMLGALLGLRAMGGLGVHQKRLIDDVLRKVSGAA